MKAIPMVIDSDPVEVLHECDHFIAVNKPVGVPTAPTHRWKGGSVVNRLLGYLGAQKAAQVRVSLASI